MDQRLHTTADSDMTGIFDDPTFDTLPVNPYTAATNSPFDPGTYMDIGSDNLFDDFTARKSTPRYLDADYTSAPSSRRPSAFQTLSHDSSISAHSSTTLNDSSPDSRSGPPGTGTTSESPPAPVAGAGGAKLPRTDHVTDNIQPLHNWGSSLNSLSLNAADFAPSTAQFDNAVLASPDLLQNDTRFFPAPTSGTQQSHSDLWGADPSVTGPANANNAPTYMTQAGPLAGPAFFFGPVAHPSPRSASMSSNTETSSPAKPFTDPAQSTTSFDDIFNSTEAWNPAAQNAPAWALDFQNAFASANPLGLTPSPVGLRSSNLPPPSAPARIPMHIAPIAAKSRVETQINIRITLNSLPPNVKYVHLPTHTIAKTKLLAPDYKPSPETLELHCMVVCTSAVKDQVILQRALRKAAAQDNKAIQARGIAHPRTEDVEEKAAEDRPLNGGEVRICHNCIGRERKRAARKKLKKEEEQAHWERYETERVVVFNTNEHKEWLEWQTTEVSKDANMPIGPIDLVAPSDTAMQVIAPMRIACYCRHQSERDGFRVIFTLKDYDDNVVAQAMTDSILITDDHKAGPVTAAATATAADGTITPVSTESSTAAAQSALSSQSMVNLSSQVPPVSTSKSTGNLQGLKSGRQKARSMARIPSLDVQSGHTSGTVTPRVLSRPASPTALSQAGPSKKRKSTSLKTHRRVTSGLSMTRADKPQQRQSLTMSSITAPPPPPRHSISGASAGPPTPHTSVTLSPNHESPFAGLPLTTSQSAFFNHPPTPGDMTPLPFGDLSRNPSLDQINLQAFFSAPNSAQHSRAPSPVLHGPNLGAFQRKPSHASTSGTPNPFRTNSFAMSNSTRVSNDVPNAPVIDKVTPSEGPITGGIEVSIYGQNFTPGMTVMFGDHMAPATTYWANRALCCVLPRGQIGPVAVRIVTPLTSHSQAPQQQHYSSNFGPRQIFTYTGENNDVRMMEMALRFYSLESTGDPERWWDGAQNAATAWMSSAAAVAGAHGMANGITNGVMPNGHDPHAMPGTFPAR